MFISTEWVEVLDEAEILSEWILHSEIVKEYRETYDALRKNEEAQKLISKFVKVKDQYEEVRRFGKYHPDYERISKEIRVIKRDVDLHEAIVKFKKAERNVQDLLDEISSFIGHEVSTSIKVPTGNPFFDSKGCSGGCGTGGSCGCKK